MEMEALGKTDLWNIYIYGIHIWNMWRCLHGFGVVHPKNFVNVIFGVPFVSPDPKDGTPITPETEIPSDVRGSILPANLRVTLP